MTGWTTSHPSRAAFVGDYDKMQLYPTGVQIDWTNVADAYKDAATQKKVLPAGLAVGALLSASDKAVSPRVDATNPAIGLLASSVTEDSGANAGGGMVGLFIGGTVYENLLPDAVAGVVSQDIKDELNAAGLGFVFVEYEDTP